MTSAYININSSVIGYSCNHAIRLMRDWKSMNMIHKIKTGITENGEPFSLLNSIYYCQATKSSGN